MSTTYQLAADLWPHQIEGIESTIRAIEEGVKRIVLTAPCGGGKTKMATELIEWGAAQWKPTALYTSRRMLFDQTAKVLERHGIEIGLRAAGHKPAYLKDVQLCMTQSEFSAVYRQKRRELHDAKIVIVDELHMQRGAMMDAILSAHVEAGAAVVALTATPLDLAGNWDRLIVAGTNSQLRKCGAHIPAITYCPDEPDLRHIKNYKVGEDLTDKDNSKAMMRPGVFGRVLKHFERLNPYHKPTILFAPDVAGSIYFAEQFHKHGIRAAHIDAKQIWLDGESMDSSDENRAAILAASEAGEITVLTNRFCLREGIDLPHIAHCVMACVFGSLTSYLQSGGRVIRAHHSLDSICVQDHGGNFTRHGSLNSDREWELGQSGYKTTGLRQEMMREKPEMEPIICPACGAARLSGPQCYQCGHRYQKRSRTVVQIDGSLQLVEGASFKPRRVKMKHDTEMLWQKMYHRAKSKKWNATFRQAEALFFYENHYYPPHTCNLMPREPGDWFEKVAHVPKEKLR